MAVSIWPRKSFSRSVGHGKLKFEPALCPLVKKGFPATRSKILRYALFARPTFVYSSLLKLAFIARTVNKIFVNSSSRHPTVLGSVYRKKVRVLVGQFPTIASFLLTKLSKGNREHRKSWQKHLLSIPSWENSVVIPIKGIGKESRVRLAGVWL